MSGRGRRAVLPPTGAVPARPPVLNTDTLVVEHRDSEGEIARYDFAALPGAHPLKRSLAEVFGARCTRSGGWASHKTSGQAWWAVRQFVTWLAQQEDAPGDVDALTASTWKRWRLSRPSGTSGQAQLTSMASLLRDHPRVPLAAREAIAERIGKVKPVEQSFSQAEFAALSATARRVFRAAHLRITENARTLAAWRRGDHPASSREWLLGEELDHLARHGDVAQAADKSARASRRDRAVKGADSVRQVRQRLFLTGQEATALAALLTFEYGFSREQVFRLVTQPPQRLSMDVLAALCDILACQPNDLIEVQVVNEELRKTAGGETPGPLPAVRRTSIRRPEGL